MKTLRWLTTANDTQMLRWLGLLPTGTLQRISDCARAVVVDRMFSSRETSPGYGGDAA